MMESDLKLYYKKYNFFPFYNLIFIIINDLYDYIFFSDEYLLCLLMFEVKINLQPFLKLVLYRYFICYKFLE